MGDRLDQLQQEHVLDLLQAWVDVYDKGQQVYDAFPEEVRAWVDEHGHRVESLVAVVSLMQPDVRVVCRSLVEDALAASLSQGIAMMEANESGQVAEGGGMEEEDGAATEPLVWCQQLDERIARLEQVVKAMGTVAQAVDRTQDL